MCPPAPAPPSLPGPRPVCRYVCEHLVAGRQVAALRDSEPVEGAVVAVAWLLSRAYGVAAAHPDPAVTARLLDVLGGVQVEALAVLASGRGRGYGLVLPTPEGAHTLRLLRLWTVGGTSGREARR